MADLRLTRLFSALALSLAASCSTSATFEGRDEAGLFPTGRVTFDFGESAVQEADPLDAGGGPRWVAEIEGTTASSEFGNTDFDLTELTVGGRLRWQRRESSQIDFLVGAATTTAELDPNGTVGVTGFDEDNTGVYLGVDARYLSGESYSVYGRLQNAWLFSDATSLRAEIGTEIQLFGPVDLLIGYRWWRYIFDEDDLFSDDADAELRLRGVVAGIHVGL